MSEEVASADSLLIAHAKLRRALDDCESRLGAAHAEIARLTEALRDAARMKTIKGARVIVAGALRDED